MMLLMYERVVVSVCAAVFLLAVLVNLSHSHSNCSVVIGTRQNVLCGDDEYCKLQALFLPVSYQWSLVELTCANKCIENNITQSYSITAYSKKTRCQWMNLKDKILLDSQRPAESSYLSPTTTHTLSTHTTHIGSPSIVTTSTPLHTPDQNKSKFTETMTKIPVWVDILLIVVITCMTLGLVVFIIGFWQYHLNWVKARKLELLKARNRRRLKLKKRQRNNQKKIS